MSAAAGGAGAAAASPPPPLELHRIPLAPFRENQAQYVALLKRALQSNDDAELEAMRPTTDEEYYRFFICAIARDIKYIVNSDMFPEYLDRKTKSEMSPLEIVPEHLIGKLNSFIAPSYSIRVMKEHYGVPKSKITRTLAAQLKYIREKLRRILGTLPSTAERYLDVLNSDFRKRKPWGADKPEDEPDYYMSYLKSSITVLQEFIRVIRDGHPLHNLFQRVPTTLFLYCRRERNGTLHYAGHIFTQIVTGVPPPLFDFLGAGRSCPDPDTNTLPYMFFVSIYKSLLDKEKALSARILADVEAAARENRCALMMTFPLPNMDQILVKHHFEEFKMPRGRGEDPVFIRGLGPRGEIACGAESTGSANANAGAGAGAGTLRHSTGGRRRTRRVLPSRRGKNKVR
jgi:hypothetical protein